MEPASRIEVIELQLKSQAAIKAQFEKEGNKVGAKRADKEIKKLNRELRRLK
jgi:hypothetical protein